ncbi:MAG: NUDIX hydrolase [Lachnospiraceae bacterium]|nr:NUDIX hydrolase [Lachnospiraceae bacterium]
MIQKFERLKRTLVRRTSILDYCEDTLRRPDGKIVRYDMMLHKGGAAIVPVMDDGSIIMVHQYRASVERVTTEIPAGSRNGLNETYERAAARELEEEIGYKPGKLSHLITIDTAIAYCTEKIEVYVAENLVKTKQHLDEDEFVDVETYSLSSLLQMIQKGEIRDSKTIASLLAYNAFHKV